MADLFLQPRLILGVKNPNLESRLLLLTTMIMSNSRTSQQRPTASTALWAHLHRQDVTSFLLSSNPKQKHNADENVRRSDWGFGLGGLSTRLQVLLWTVAADMPIIFLYMSLAVTIFEIFRLFPPANILNFRSWCRHLKYCIRGHLNKDWTQPCQWTGLAKLSVSKWISGQIILASFWWVAKYLNATGEQEVRILSWTCLNSF